MQIVLVILGDLSDGDIQWMTAGSGIIHQEMPKGDQKRPYAWFSTLGKSAFCR